MAKEIEEAEAHAPSRVSGRIPEQGIAVRAGEATIAWRVPLSGILRRHARFIALSSLAFGVLLFLGRGMYFWGDEWQFIRERSVADPATWFLPHAQHFVAAFAAVYTALLAVFGTTTYLPFLAVALATHVAFTGAIYALIDRHVGRGPALTAAAMLLFLGASYLNLAWAFQMGAMGSVALATWGLFFIRQRPALAAFLMGTGAATSGFALAVVPAAALYGWSRRATLACAVPVLAYAGWFLLAHVSPDARADSPTLASWWTWVWQGVVYSSNALVNMGSLSPLILGLAGVLVLRSPDRSAAAAGIAAVLTLYAMAGLTRGGMNGPAGMQYVYVGAAFLIPVFASTWLVVPRWGRPAVCLLVMLSFAESFSTLLAYSANLTVVFPASDPRCLLCVGP
jgi:hypothetical protein